MLFRFCSWTCIILQLCGRRNKDLPHTPAHVRDIYFFTINVIQFKIKSFDKKNKHLHANIYFSVWESTFIHAILCIFQCKLYKNATQHTAKMWIWQNAAEYKRLRYVSYWKFLFIEYGVYLYAALHFPLYILIQQRCICNAFPVSKHPSSDIDIAFPILISHKQIWLIGVYFDFTCISTVY